MIREDHGLATILQYENVAWFEDGAVRILDRRIYPREIRSVICRNYGEVAQAIRDMVTQSAGPYTAAGMGMVLAAYQMRYSEKVRTWEELQVAAEVLSTARPTTQNRMRQVTAGCLAVAKTALDAGEDVSKAIFDHTIASLNRRYSIMERVGKNLADHFEDDSVIMTQCYGETIVGMMLRACRARGVNPKFIVPETRPYLQGARLTASVISEMGFETTVITDNMAAWAMEQIGVNLFTSAADTITIDGYVVNKVGTLQLAILAECYGIPYYVTGMPDLDMRVQDIRIEQRNPEEVLSVFGQRHTLPDVGAWYPAFDITPPKLITGVVTDQGILSPDQLASYSPLQKSFY
ncbi:MAG: S-methyl-5-thioribose-1-phosphate isomerase [Tissierellia bacterium]|nr:S-methyl-5-thioribose-1-phosphate isomerase [Tissierellia bacterium]